MSALNIIKVLIRGEEGEEDEERNVFLSAVLSHRLYPQGSTLHKLHQYSRRLIGGTVEHQQT